METEDVSVLLNTQIQHAQNVSITLFNKCTESQNLLFEY